MEQWKISGDHDTPILSTVVVFARD